MDVVFIWIGCINAIQVKIGFVWYAVSSHLYEMVKDKAT